MSTTINDTPGIDTQTASLRATAAQLASGGRGILAADESIKTMSQRLTDAGVSASEDTRAAYRELLLCAPGLAEHVSGMILCDETFRQRTSDGRTFPETAHALGILPGIKVDTGTEPFASTSALRTTGLTGLSDRLAEYAVLGAAFAKWRAVFDVNTLDDDAIADNARSLAEYAAACQANGIVPIVEPEVLCAGTHDVSASAAATRLALDAVFGQLSRRGVDLQGIVLKPNFVSPGLGARSLAARSIATITYDVLRANVPADVATIAFLSGGNPTDQVCAWLAELTDISQMPWALTFSFGRALVNDALATWGGEQANVATAQAALLANCATAAAATRRP